MELGLQYPVMGMGGNVKKSGRKPICRNEFFQQTLEKQWK
jgi:hypothetical protein